MENKCMPMFTQFVNNLNYNKETDSPTFILGYDDFNNSVSLSLSEMKNMIILGGLAEARKKLYEAMFLSILTHNEPEDLLVYPYDIYMRELHVLSNMPQVAFKEENLKKILDEVCPHLKRRYELFREVGVVNLTTYNKVANEKLPSILCVFNVSSSNFSSMIETRLNKLVSFGPAVGIYTIFISSDSKSYPLPKIIKHSISTVLSFVPKKEDEVDDDINIFDSSKTKISLDERFKRLNKKISDSHDEIILNVSGKEQKAIAFNIAKDESLYFINKIKKIENIITNYSGVTPLLPDEEEDYDMLKKCAYFVLSLRKASLSLIQREFALGFNRARKILNRLTELKILVQDDNSPYKNVIATEELLDILFSQR